MQKVSDLLAEVSNALAKATQIATNDAQEATHYVKNDLTAVLNKIEPAKEFASEEEQAVLDHLHTFVSEAKSVFSGRDFPAPVEQIVNTIVSQPVFGAPVVFTDHDPVNNTRTITTQSTMPIANDTTIMTGNQQVVSMDNNGNPIGHDQLNPPPSDAPLGSEGIITTDAEEVADKKVVDPVDTATDVKVTENNEETKALPAPEGKEGPVQQNSTLTAEPFTPESTTIHGNTGNEA